MDCVDENNEPSVFDALVPLGVELPGRLHQRDTPQFVEVRTDIEVSAVVRLCPARKVP